MTLALAIDLGGTKVEAALVDADGVILPHTRVRAETGAEAAQDAEAAVTAVRSVVRACRNRREWAEVSAAGIGAAGPVDLSAGTISPVNLAAMRDWPIAGIVREESGLDDVTLRLDGTGLALAEVWRGAARGARDAIVVTVSTGVGGGIISGGRMLAGATGNAGHIGQVIIGASLGGDELAGHASTVEGAASGPNTVAWARSRGFAGTTGEDLAAAWATGDPVACAAVARSARAVALGLVDAATLLDLDLAVIGGGFSRVTPDYIDQVAAVVTREALLGFAARLRVLPAELGGDAPLVGAAALVHRPQLLG